MPSTMVQEWLDKEVSLEPYDCWYLVGVIRGNLQGSRGCKAKIKALKIRPWDTMQSPHLLHW